MSEKFQAALLKNTLVFKQYQLNLLEEKGKVLNQSISFINQLKSQKLVRFAILQKTFQKHTQIFTIKKIILNALIVAMNAIIAENYF